MAMAYVLSAWVMKSWACFEYCFSDGTGKSNEPTTYLDSHICQCVFLERERSLYEK